MITVIEVTQDLLYISLHETAPSDRLRESEGGDDAEGGKR